MSRLTKFFGIEVIINEKMQPFFSKQDTLDSDLYGLMKEVGCMKYANVELELRLSNLEEMVKTLTKREA